MPLPVAVAALPESLRVQTQRRIERWRQAAGAEVAAVLEAPDLAESLPRVFACSEFVAHECSRSPGRLAELVANGSLDRGRDPQEWAEAFAAAREATGVGAFMRELRDVRRREMLRIAWRDLAGRASLQETLAELSALADAAIRCALAQAIRELEGRYGRPRAGGVAQELLVLAMGKLGGGELNFSSDVDLVFLYPEAGETQAHRPMSHEEFFTRAGRRLIHFLAAPTDDGIVFRVDMRLRPYGDSGPLAMSFAAFEAYLQQQGREWERYAYVKARPVSAESSYGPLYRDILRPFVYRRYLDYGVFDSLRRMKDLVSREVERRDLRNNVKLGPGGIREIEFIVQTLQLVRGGGMPQLQRRELLEVLPRLASHGLLEHRVCEELAAAYRFLRRLENRLQAWQDRQVHELPADECSRERLALAMGLESAESLRVELARHRQAVSAHFQAIVFGPAAPPEGDRRLSGLAGVWEGSLETEESRRRLAELGIRAIDQTLAALERLRQGPLSRRLGETARKRLDTLIPRLLTDVAELDQQGQAIERLVRIIEAIGGRAAYLSLLNENVEALKRLTMLCARSEFLAEQVAEHPLLIDELLDPRVFEEPPSRRQFAAELRSRISGIESLDLERRSEALMQFQRASLFRIAVADLSGRLPLMKVSDRLTEVAELVLGEVLDAATAQLSHRHGRPSVRSRPCGFAIVGYGKLGGLELGYGSDLDLVFLHEASDEAETAGKRPIAGALYFARLGQRIVSMLGLQTSSGALYETDMRLRPSGQSGPLVSSLAAFEEYQRSRAWSWEHQALLRARAVAGEPRVRAEFERIRAEVLQHCVRREALSRDVRTMREKMRRELARPALPGFELKQDRGGLTDIEFLVQYWVLRWAEEVPELIAYTDNVRQLAVLAVTGCVAAETCEFLAEAYRRYRERVHHLSLQDAPAVVDEHDVLVGLARRVAAIWAETFPAV